MHAAKYVVTKEIEFDAGHRVPDHKSKCSNPHGHRYRVVAAVTGDLQIAGSSTGMVVDFGDIKDALTKLVHDRFDHGFIVYGGDAEMRNALANHASWKVITVPWTPTAENMAAAVYSDLEYFFHNAETGCRLLYVEVWETPTSMAMFPAP